MGKYAKILRNDYGYPLFPPITSYYEGPFLTRLGKVSALLALLIILAGLVLLFCGFAYAEPIHLKASWYSRASLKKEGTWKHGEQKMANGQRFDENALTCAARLYPLGTHLLVTNQKNGRKVRVVVTDRIGPRFAKTRIDLSKGAFAKIADLKTGIIQVRVEVIR